MTQCPIWQVLTHVVGRLEPTAWLQQCMRRADGKMEMWELAASHLPGRTADECQGRWRFLSGQLACSSSNGESGSEKGWEAGGSPSGLLRDGCAWQAQRGQQIASAVLEGASRLAPSSGMQVTGLQLHPDRT